MKDCFILTEVFLLIVIRSTKISLLYTICGYYFSFFIQKCLKLMPDKSKNFHVYITLASGKLTNEGTVSLCKTQKRKKKRT